jgi:hypothetical protein
MGGSLLHGIGDRTLMVVSSEPLGMFAGEGKDREPAWRIVAIKPVQEGQTSRLVF